MISLISSNVLQTKIPTCTRLMSILASKLKFNEFGEPIAVVKMVQEEMNEPKLSEILVKILAAPVNPADINTIQGKYPVKPVFPAIPGNECVARVISIGPDVKSIKIDDHIIPFATGLGTWCSHAIFSEKQVIKVPKEIGFVEAATMTVNPCTAYRMLKDFVDLKSGDTIIQNGANSAVGQLVFQLCKQWGINSVGIVRSRPDIESLTSYLKELGATEILTEEQLRTTKLFRDKILNKPKLALNCIGGKSALEISRYLADKGTMVTYGGMSREPVTVPTASLIFKDIQYKGFWMTRWTKENYNNPNRQLMFNELFELTISNILKAPTHKLVPFIDYKYVMENALDIKGFTGQKFILDFSAV